MSEWTFNFVSNHMVSVYNVFSGVFSATVKPSTEAVNKFPALILIQT